ncbi:MAG: nucleotide-binding protein [Methanobacteriota archaeon]
MAQKSIPTVPPSRVLNKNDLENAVRSIQRRIDDLNAFDISLVKKRFDPRANALQDKIAATLADIFGNDTAEFRRHSVGSLDNLTVYDERDYTTSQLQAIYKQGIEAAVTQLESLRDLLNERLADMAGASPTPAPSAKERHENNIDPKKIFVVHGRNLSARNAIFEFLRAINLNPIEWSQATAMSQKGSPYVGEILEAAFSKAQAVLVLITGDDEAKLREQFIENNDHIYEKELTIQARPNVLFEAGMAFGFHSERTVLVEIEKTRPFSDIAGRYIIRLNNSTEKRQELAQCLKNAGCDVDLTGTYWHKAGDFNECIFPFNKSLESELEYKQPFYYGPGDPIPYCPICWESDRKKIHLNGPHDIPGEQPFYKCLKCNNNF